MGRVVLGPRMRFQVTPFHDGGGIYYARWVPRLTFELGMFAGDPNPVEDGRRLCVSAMHSAVGSYRGTRVRIPTSPYFTGERLGRVPGREEIAGWR